MTRRWPYLVCRGSTALLAALGVAQVILAGGFLSGYYDALTMHLFVGMGLVLVALLQIPALVFLRRAGGPGALRIGILLPFLLGGQAMLGVFRVLLLHVPLGVVFIVGLFHLTRQVWSAPLPGVSPADFNPLPGVSSADANPLPGVSSAELNPLPGVSGESRSAAAGGAL